MTPFRGDGHLTDLALEHALDGSPLAGTEAHLAACAVCAGRLQAAGAVELPPLAFPSPSLAVQPAMAAPANRPVWIGLIAVAAALVLVALLPRDAGDGIRLRGEALTLQVWRDGGATSERLVDGDRVAPGDRLGFRVRHREPGHLLVLGLDDADAAYVCYPQAEGGRSVPVDASLELDPLPEAVRLDAVGASERLIAVLCDAPFTLDEVSGALADGDVPEGCVADGVTLVKR